MPEERHAPVVAQRDRALEFFTRDEAAIVEAAMARIFPDDELGPGAIEADALTYLDRALTGAELHLQGFYRVGLRRLDAAARERFERPFAGCAPDEQDTLIGAMERDELPSFGKAPTAPAFFEALRAHTIEGVFGDPAHGGNRNLAGWRLIGYLGPQPSYTHEEQQLDAPVVRERIFTAADYPLRAEDNKS